MHIHRREIECKWLTGRRSCVGDPLLGARCKELGVVGPVYTRGRRPDGLPNTVGEVKQARIVQLRRAAPGPKAPHVVVPVVSLRSNIVPKEAVESTEGGRAVEQHHAVVPLPDRCGCIACVFERPGPNREVGSRVLFVVGH